MGNFISLLLCTLFLALLHFQQSCARSNQTQKKEILQKTFDNDFFSYNNYFHQRLLIKLPSSVFLIISLQISNSPLEKKCFRIYNVELKSKILQMVIKLWTKASWFCVNSWFFSSKMFKILLKLYREVLMSSRN